MEMAPHLLLLLQLVQGLRHQRLVRSLLWVPSHLLSLQSLVLLREEGQCLRLLRVGRRDSHGKVPCFLYTVLPRTVMMFGHFCHLSNGCFLWAIDILP